MAPPKKRPPQGKPGQKRPPQGRRPQQARKPAGNSPAAKGATPDGGAKVADAEAAAAATTTTEEAEEATLSKSAEERKAKREAARQERLAAARRRQQAKRRKQALLGIVLLVAVGAATWYGVQQARGQRAAVTAATEAAGCTDIRSFEDEGQRHLGPNEQFDDYKTNPPTSGPHRAQPAPWGSFREAPEREALVHNMEHGGIVVFYKDLSDGQVDQLDEFVDDHVDGVISVPDSQIEKPVAIAAWRHSQQCDELNLTVIEGFIDERCNKGPEKVGTTCQRD